MLGIRVVGVRVTGRGCENAVYRNGSRNIRFFFVFMVTKSIVSARGVPNMCPMSFCVEISNLKNDVFGLFCPYCGHGNKFL